MSLYSLLTSRGSNWWDAWDYPSRIADQHFGMGLLDSDLLSPTLYRGYVMRPRTRSNVQASGHSEVTNDKDRFKVMLNVGHFKRDEIEVKTVDNSVVIHAKHEEKSDEHGFISREFTRRYLLPEGTDPETVTSSLSPTGVLVVEAPKKDVEPIQERVVPIKMES